MIESRYVKVRDLRLHYLEVGEGRPVLLLHGWPTSAHLWRHCLVPIAGVGRRAIALDLPGFGLSDKPLGSEVSFPFFERGIDGFLTGIGIDRLGLAVHDLGGPVGLYWASKRPERLLDLALLKAGHGLHPRGFEQIVAALGHIHCPVRVVYGTRDRLLPDIGQTVARITALMPHARVTAIEECGHSSRRIARMKLPSYWPSSFPATTRFDQVGDPGADALTSLDLLSIGQFSRRCRLPISTLRYYHEVGLLTPAVVDPGSGYRYYSIDQLQASVVIAEMRALGIGPEAIKRVLAGGPGGRAALQAERERLRADLRRREGAMNYVEAALAGRASADLSECEVVTRQRQYALVVSGKVAVENVVEDVTRLVASARQHARRQGHVASGQAGALFPLDLGSPTIRVTAFVPVPEASGSVPLPEGQAAMVTYRGDVRGVALAYQSLLDWIERRGMRAVEPLIEEYAIDGDRLVVRLTALVAG